MSRLFLAPMEGLADEILRDVLTRIGHYDGCVTEFIRVSGNLLPPRAFKRTCPELGNASKTRAGTPVRVQLLGANPVHLADNAARLAELKPAGIDLNFGCPAPLINRHGCGATLLDQPELLHQIAANVRQAVPISIPVTAKMRLGVSNTDMAIACARALEAGGIQELTVHARTMAEGYRPPAHWEWIARIRESVRLPIIANGEVWNVADYRHIRAITGCADVMLGRGAVADPLLTWRIGGALQEQVSPADWLALCPLIADFWTQVMLKLEARHAPGRLKQWLGMMRHAYPEARTLHDAVREMKSCDEITATLKRSGIAWQASRAA